MSFIKYVVPALAIAKASYAQSSVDPCSVSATTTLTAITDATAIAACPTFTGNIALATGLAGALSFDGSLKEIDGDLIAQNVGGIQSLSAGSLQTITGDFTLMNMSQVTNANFPQLDSIRGSLNWVSCPNLVTAIFADSVQRINSVTISDTQIQDLSGINLKSAQNVVISQNQRLNTLSWQLTSVDSKLFLDGNGGGAGFNATFGNLASAGEIQINQVNSLIMNALKNVTGTMQIYNAQVETLSFPNLTMTGDFDLQNNPNLNNVSVPAFKTIKGGLNLQQNPDLTGTIDFPALNLITGAINCTGAFDELLFAKINTISGAVNIQSTGNLSETCSAITQYRRNNMISVTPVCRGAQQGSSTLLGDGSGTSSGDPGATSTAAAVSSYAVPSAVTIASLFAAMFGLL